MKLLTSQTTVAPSQSTPIRGDYRMHPRLVKVAIKATIENPAGTASVRLQGRMDTHDDWFDLDDAFTATGVQSLQLMPEVRFNVTAVDGSVDAWIDALQPLQWSPLLPSGGGGALTRSRCTLLLKHSPTTSQFLSRPWPRGSTAWRPRLTRGSTSVGRSPTPER